MQTTRIPRPIAAWLLALGLLLAGVPALATTYYVANTGNDTNTGTDPAFPKQHIQAAINVTVSGDIVIVADATYTGAGNRDLDFGGRNITLRSASGDPARCILDCEGAGHGFTFISGETGEAKVEGLTIRNGTSDYDNGVGFDHGGGMYIEGSSPTITTCTFSGNTSSAFGGGMCVLEGSPTLTNCTFSGNTASNEGGGIEVEISSATLTNCTFIGNTAPNGGGMSVWRSSATLTNCIFSGNTARYGGGMYVYASSNTTLTNCTFSGNSAGYDGGGMDVETSNSTLTNCTFTRNTGGWVGGGMSVSNSSPTLTNCTFTGNTGGTTAHYYYGGGGMYVDNGGNPMLTNCILWGDTPDELQAIHGSSIRVTHSAIQGGWDGTGNFAADPCFLNAATGVLRLQPTSPCINAGDNSVVTSPPFLTNEEGILLDLDGNPRIQYGTVDMGAYEAQDIATATVSGTVTLEQMSASAPPPTLTFTFRLVDTGGGFERIVTLGENGAFTLTDIPRKEYIVHIKGAKWLAQNQAVNTTNGDVTGIQATLKAADANNDNSVDVLDLDLLIASFDATPTTPHWNEGRADFNCDGSVDVLDLNLLIQNFDMVGDF